MFILEPDKFGDCDISNLEEFVLFWEQFYNDDGQDQLYLNALNVGEDLTVENLIKLLRWKDPRFLTHPLKKDGQPNPRVERVLQHKQQINQFRHEQLTEDEFSEVTNGIFPSGIIWQLFLFHIARPHHWPIADRYVFGAYNKLTKNKAPKTLADFGQFRAFFNQLSERFLADAAESQESLVNRRKRIDRALFAYGLFLERYAS